MDPKHSSTLRRNLASVKKSIDAARRYSPHAASEVTIVAVTKHVDAAMADAIIQAGVSDIGENRLQVALPKFAAMRERPRRHLIGSLQSNKVRVALTVFDCVHSLDRLSLAEQLHRYLTTESHRPFPCFLQVNTSGERQKHGIRPDETLSTVKQITTTCAKIHLVGLMTMAAENVDAQAARPCFRLLREIRDDLVRAGLPCCALSMGMSNDFPIAVEEGATHVRIGSALFSGVAAVTSHVKRGSGVTDSGCRE